MSELHEKWRSLSPDRLAEEVRRHNRLYWENAAPEISDYDFDWLVRLLEKVNPESRVLLEIGAGALAAERYGEAVLHNLAMLSLDKCYSLETLRKWAAKFEGEVVVSPKVDGMAVSLRYDAQGALALAATRGDGLQGEDVTANVRTISTIPKHILHPGAEIRGEVYMRRSIFARYQENFANPRNLAAGALKQKDPRRTASYGLSFFAYDLIGIEVDTEMDKLAELKKSGFEPVAHHRYSQEELSVGYTRYLACREELDFEIDGVVYKANSLAEQRRLGVTAHHPRYAIAYKLQGDSAVTGLKDIEWSVSRTGAITPIAMVEPVLLSGATISRALLHNWGILREMEVTAGSKLTVMRRGGVIPKVESLAEKGPGAPVEPPSHCPACGAAARIDGDFIYCSAPENCRLSRIAMLEHFVKVIDCEGFGRALLEQLYDRELVKEPADLYGLTLEQLLPLDRVGEKLALKLLDNISARRSLSLETFLRSLGIEELGKHVAAILGTYGTLESVRQLSEEDLSALHTIGEVIARKVAAGLKEKAPLMERLLAEVTLAAPPAEGRSTGVLSGKKVLFTGKLSSFNRKAAQELVLSQGGLTPAQVVKDLDYLVVGDEGSPLFGQGRKGSKLTKAEAYNDAGASIEIISEAAFRDLLAGDS